MKTLRVCWEHAALGVGHGKENIIVPLRAKQQLCFYNGEDLVSKMFSPFMVAPMAVLLVLIYLSYS